VLGPPAERKHRVDIGFDAHPKSSAWSLRVRGDF
jgi:hypothetical protein